MDFRRRARARRFCFVVVYFLCIVFVFFCDDVRLVCVFCLSVVFECVVCLLWSVCLSELSLVRICCCCCLSFCSGCVR